MKYAKFIIALLGAGVTIAANQGIVLPQVLTNVIPIITALSVYLVPNAPSH